MVDKIEGDNLTVKTSKGDLKTVKITDETSITKKTDKLKKEDLKNGTKVSVFTKGKDDKVSAVRIVVSQ